MKALVGLLAACVVFFTFARSAPAQVVFSFGSGYCAPSYYPWYGGYYGYPGYAYYSYYPSYFGFGWGGYYRPWWRHRYYGGIMADGTGGTDAAGTVVTGMAADGVAMIDSESRQSATTVVAVSAF